MFRTTPHPERHPPDRRRTHGRTTGLTLAILASLLFVAMPAQADATYGTWTLSLTIDGEEIPLSTTTSSWGRGDDGRITTASGPDHILATAPATIRLEAVLALPSGPATDPFWLEVHRYTDDTLSDQETIASTRSDADGALDDAALTIEEAGDYRITFGSFGSSAPGRGHALSGSLSHLELEAPAPPHPAYEVPGLGDEKRDGRATDAIARHCARGAAGAHSKHCR